MSKLSIHGRKVEGDLEVLRYLLHLDSKEADVLFRYARQRGEARFEYKFKDYTLDWDESSGDYVVERRD